MSNRIYIFDTTLRDGEQTPGVNLNLIEKAEIALQLERLGVDVIEAGFPATSNGDFAAVKEVSKIIKNAAVAGLCRTRKSDIERAWEALKGAVSPRIHTFIATSPIHMQYKLKMTPDEVMESAIEAVKFSKSLCSDVEFSAEDATRSDPKFLYKLVEAVINAGANVVNLPDTVGYTTPDEFSEFLKGFYQNVPNIHKAILSVHCHDDLGLAVANSIAGVMAGARQIEGTINGLGERAGNASIEEIIMGFNTRYDFYKIKHGINISEIYRTSKMVQSLTGVEVQATKAIVGANAFKHESGIHQHGMLEHSSTYEIMTPESIGIFQKGLVLGKHSGRHAFADRLKEMGYEFSEDRLNKLFERFKDLADRKKEITDEDLEALVVGNIQINDKVYELDSFQIQSGNKIKATASVCLKYDNQVKCEAAVGEGPIDAAYNAIDKILNREIKLEHYSIKGVTSGKDALGEVTVRIRSNGDTHTGKGLASDIIEASISAYINAINRMVTFNGCREGDIA